ncbi:CPBP family intramembrane glutamic endopeptidase [Oceanivirga salmonicida]|uniref:CPBP family intramembrane glutamic endopeptidase n=1 Tax=Oceanivirga salmonicida TaxID=1769291 RepID=UPI0012E28DD0|nr:CPBP family intramembrane glutamic endopeptidase [Oceanivirga salmonicida]
MTKKIKGVILVIILVTIMTFIDIIGGFSYWVRSAIKLMLFGMIPYLYMLKNNIEMPTFKKDDNFNKILMFSILIIISFIIGGTIFFKLGLLNSVKTSLSNSVGVSENNYIYVYIYIVIVNCTLEEFFFRHFALKFIRNTRYTILFSSILFSIYHTGMLRNMFLWYIFALSMLGLMIVGIVFCLLNKNKNSILNSTIVHLVANFCINTIGLIIMYS